MNKTLKNIEIINSLGAIKELMEMKLPSKISWNLGKNLKRMLPAYNDFDEAEKRLIEEYSEKDKDGKIIQLSENQIKIKENSIQEFIDKKTELLNFEDTIDIHIIQLSDLEGFDIKGTTLFSLEFMIEDSESDAK